MFSITGHASASSVTREAEATTLNSVPEVTHCAPPASALAPRDRAPRSTDSVRGSWPLLCFRVSVIFVETFTELGGGDFDNYPTLTRYTPGPVRSQPGHGLLLSPAPPL